jgi:hypothetical protein
MLLAAVSSSAAVATATVPVRRGNVVGIGAPYTTTGTGVVAAAAAWDNQRCSSSSGASKVQSSLAAFRSSSRRSAAVQSPVSCLLFSSRLGGEIRMGVTKKSLGGVALHTHKRLSSSIRAQAADGEVVEELVATKQSVSSSSSSSSSGGIVLPAVGVACLGAILFGYHLGYVHTLPHKNKKTPMSTLSLTETPTYPICINNNNLSMKSSLAPLWCHSFILRSETHVSFSCFHAPIHHSEP